MSTDSKSNYYDAGGIETIDVIKAKLTKEQFKGFCLGNAIKYNCRYNFKHDNLESKKRDIEKAINYLSFLKETENKNLKAWLEEAEK